MVPGKPNHPTSTKPLIKTPAAAPILLVKYSIEMEEPARCGNILTTPALMSGKVMPSRMEGGRISKPDTSSLRALTAVGEPRAGMRVV